MGGIAASPFALERWFASLRHRPRHDLTASGAAPLRLADLLAVASAQERDEVASVSLGYGPAAGSLELRRAIASRYARTDPREVVVTTGAIEALHLAVAALLRPGDEVVVQDPMYGAVAGLARLRGARVVPWRLDPERAFHASPASLGSLLGGATRVVAITQPNGPTGSILEEEELQAVVDLLAPRGIWLLSDEVCRDLALHEGPAVPSASERYARAVSIGDLAKPYGLGGLRIGWLVTRSDQLREQIARLRDYTTLGVPTLSDALGRIAVAHHATLVARPIQQARHNLELLRSLAARDHALSLPPPRAGVTAFVGVSGAARIQARLWDEGIGVVPGELFGHPDRLRIGLAVPAVEFAAAMDRLARLL